MKSRAGAAALTAVALVLAATSLSMLRGQTQHNPEKSQERFEENPLPVVDYADEVGHQKPKDEKRQRRGRRYNEGAVEKKGGKGGATLFNDWEVGLPALPTETSDAIIVGTVVDAQAHLSPDRTGVYSEFTVRVDEILKDLTASLTAGGFVAADRAGGRVRYSSGDVVPYTIAEQGSPRKNQRYVLFLKSEDQNFRILTGYELHEGRVRALDHPAKFRKLDGVGEAAFLGQIREAINSAASPEAPEMER